jgi:lysophospholipase L1-like esterase
MKRILLRAVQRSALAAVSLAAGLGLAEIALAARGFKPGWRYTRTWAADDVQSRYKLNPGFYPDLFGAAARINSYEARGPEPRHPEIVSLGDSCTFGVGLREEDTYAGQLSARGIETVNAGVPGYNSYSGLQHLRDSSLLSLHPKLVTIYFGWNDHWRAIATESAFARLRPFARYSRVLSRLLSLQRSLWDPGWGSFRWFAQVPLAQFKENLRGMIAASRSAGAEVVLITAPSEPRLVAAHEGFFTDHSLAEYKDHERYAAAVREVAAETKAGLVDFESEMKKRASADPHEYFIDFVHPNRKGQGVLADLLTPLAQGVRRRSAVRRLSRARTSATIPTRWENTSRRPRDRAAGRRSATRASPTSTRSNPSPTSGRRTASPAGLGTSGRRPARAFSART